MAYEKKHGQAVLFKNDRKQTPTHPDWTGDIHLDGTDFWLSGWVKESKKGAKYLSISVGQEKKPKGEQAAKQDDSDIPFDI